MSCSGASLEWLTGLELFWSDNFDSGVTAEWISNHKLIVLAQLLNDSAAVSDGLCLGS